MAKAKIACQLIYKRRTTLNGNCPPETGPGPLALLCLLTPSLTSPCYMSPPPSNATVLVTSSVENISKGTKVSVGTIDQMREHPRRGRVPDELVTWCHSGTEWWV